MRSDESRCCAAFLIEGNADGRAASPRLGLLFLRRGFRDRGCRGEWWLRLRCIEPATHVHVVVDLQAHAGFSFLNTHACGWRRSGGSAGSTHWSAVRPARGPLEPAAQVLRALAQFPTEPDRLELQRLHRDAALDTQLLVERFTREGRRLAMSHMFAHLVETRNGSEAGEAANLIRYTSQFIGSYDRFAVAWLAPTVA